MSEQSFYVYLLVASSSGNTYVGATVNLDHRLRQHNGEIKGGAKATSIRVKLGEKCVITYKLYSYHS
jgi:predicted GIY-YIG superfamily endonuclease